MKLWTFSLGGYLVGTVAPGRGVSAANARSAIAKELPPSRITSPKENFTEVSQEGKPNEDIYLVTHNQLLAHAAAVKLYKEKYQVLQSNNFQECTSLKKNGNCFCKL
jgi:hypothetical protein